MKGGKMRDSILMLVDMLLKNKLTANQFIFMYLKIIKMDEKLYQYLETSNPLSRKELTILEERGFIVNVNPTVNDYWADGYLVTKRFHDAISPDHSYAEEFWETYPAFYNNNQKQLPLKNIAKHDFLNRYTMIVRSEADLHERIMRSLRYQKGVGEIMVRIDRWMDNCTWESIEQEIDHLRRKINGQN